MSTCPPSTCKWSKRVGVATVALACCVAVPASQPHVPPFLDTFRANNEPAIVSKMVSFPSAVGTVKGYLARPDTKEVLPAVLLLHDEAGLTPWMQTSAREMASIGFVVLALDLEKRLPLSGKAAGPLAALTDEATLADLSAAVRWLRRRPDVLAERIGVAGWAWGGEQALALAATTPLQGCIVCYASLTDAPALMGGLRGTPVLAIVAGRDPALPAFRKALAAGGGPVRIRELVELPAGFMRPRPGKPFAHAETEQAWVDVYNFLGKYVEDAPENGPWMQHTTADAPVAHRPVATIADVMRTINHPDTGIRGSLIRGLEKEPSTVQQWKSIRAEAALIAEAGGLLQGRLPSKGSRSHWVERAQAYVAAARQVVTAADQRDFTAARRGLEELGASCAACHKQHR
jgi:carboxymethylenebutenolidase